MTPEETYEIKTAFESGQIDGEAYATMALVNIIREMKKDRVRIELQLQLRLGVMDPLSADDYAVVEARLQAVRDLIDVLDSLEKRAIEGSAAVGMMMT